MNRLVVAWLVCALQAASSLHVAVVYGEVAMGLFAALGVAASLGLAAHCWTPAEPKAAYIGRHRP